MTKMDEKLATRGIVLLGCGKMGSALLAGWLQNGLPAKSVYVIDPNPSQWLRAQGVHINAELPANPAILLLAVKPQMMADASQQVVGFGGKDTLIVSIAAGTSIATFEATFGANTPIIRAMPNTPAAVGQGITAIIGNECTKSDDLDMAQALLSAVGQVVQLESEAQMDAVTGVSGSGPAYVFYMIDCLTEAGIKQGLSPELAAQLASATVAGAGALAQTADDSPEQLRINVTSPNGTTQAGLEVLMNAQSGLSPLIAQTVAAAANRSRALGNG